MKMRILSAAAAIVLLAAVTYAGKTAVGLAVFVLAAAGIREFFKALEKGGYRPVYILGYISCLPLLYLAAGDFLPGSGIFQQAGPVIWTQAAIFALLAALFCLVVFSGGRYRVADIAVTFFGIFYVVFLFSFVTLTRNLKDGYLLIWPVFIGAWATDTFAYFAGTAFGRTKILPAVSPKKSLEGCAGGALGCVLAMTVFGASFAGKLHIPVIHFAILGLVCGVVSQVGDWSASAVKRAVGIKDYGGIMPGHGGVLDRMDSMLFTAPAVYFYISFLIPGVRV